MKKLLTIIGVLLCALTVSAQRDFVYQVFTVDTLTDAGTLTFTPDANLVGLYEYEWQILADSLSGGTAGTATLYTANDNSGANYAAISGKTYTVVGAATQTGGFITGTMYGAKQQLAIVGTGTQSTKITVSVVYKRIGEGKQYKDMYYKVFSSDSTDAAESIYYEFDKNLQGRYYYSWQIEFDEVSGSATSTVQLQEGCDNEGSKWADVSGVTAAKTADGESLFEGTCYGSNQRLKLTQSTTGKWRYTVYVTYKKIK
jgi:hypothetical protein